MVFHLVVNEQVYLSLKNTVKNKVKMDYEKKKLSFAHYYIDK